MNDDETVTVTFPTERQAVTLWPGGGQSPITIGDQVELVALLGSLPGPIRRAVFAARLRAIADMLDDRAADK